MKVVWVRGHVPLPCQPRQKIGTCVAVFISRQIIGVKISGASRQKIGSCVAALRNRKKSLQLRLQDQCCVWRGRQ